ncbi:MAG: hypothetical protein ACLFVU_08475 [Phycisphaerae bacterium]
MWVYKCSECGEDFCDRTFTEGFFCPSCRKGAVRRVPGVKAFAVRTEQETADARLKKAGILAALGLLPFVGWVTTVMGMVFAVSAARVTGRRIQAAVLLALCILLFFGQASLMVAVAGGFSRVRELGPRAKCKSSLSAIGKAFHTYAAGNNQKWFTMGNQRRFAAPVTSRSTEQAFWQNEGDCVAQHWWLLVHGGTIGENAFVCPADNTVDVPGARYGFDGWSEISYALQPSTRHPTNPAWPNAPGQVGSTIVLADRPKMAGGRYDLTKTPGPHGTHYNALTVTGNVTRLQPMQWSADPADGNIFLPAVPGRGNITEHASDSRLHWGTIPGR